MKSILYKLFVLSITATLLNACSKYEDRLAVQNLSSGIVSVGQNGQSNIGGAKIDETITVYAKIGEPGAAVKIYVGGTEAEMLTHGTINTIVRSESGVQSIGVVMDTFNVKVPAAAKVGPGILYFTLNGVSKPALAFEVYKPDILIPGQSFVEPFLFTYMDSVLIDNHYQYQLPHRLKDGPSAEAVVNQVLGLSYDAQTEAFYFVDQQPDDLSARIRKLQNGVVTTIAGGGSDYLATTALQLKLGSVQELEPGPDGKLYFTSVFMTDPDPVTQLTGLYAMIMRFNPLSGTIERVLGGSRSIEKYPSRSADDYRGIEDGTPDVAMIYNPSSLTFDKEGNLCFLDGAAEYDGSATLLRRFKGGKLETLLGKVNKEVIEFEDVDGKMYSVTFYTNAEIHADGFADEVRLTGGRGLVQAGNGKFYVLCAGGGWNTNIVEINLDTKEAATIVGIPDGQYNGITTGTFKEVGLGTVTTFDLDFDGNILFGHANIYKMDLQQETIAKVAGGRTGSYSAREIMKQKQKGNEAALGVINEIVFDQFGNLYVGYEYTIPDVDTKISKVTIIQ